MFSVVNKSSKLSKYFQAFSIMSSKPASSSSSNLAAIIQLTCTSNKAGNFEQCQSLIVEAKKRGASIAFLPEAFDFIGESSEQTGELAEPLDGETISNYRAIAMEHKISLSLGGFHEREDGYSKLKNTHVLIGDTGSILGTYSKAHLYDVDIPGKVRLKESDYVLPGPRIADPVPSKVGKIGLGICYDLRFPELSLALARRGADILTFPSAFTVTTGQAHWESLLRARAIETQCYVIAAAQTGQHNAKRSSFGHSVIIDPWGTVIAQCGEGEGLALAEIKPDYLAQVRRNMPVWQHRRGDLYGLIAEGDAAAIQDDAEEDANSSSIEFGPVLVPSKCLVLRSRLSLVFVNRKPVLPGHLLVIPKRKVNKLKDLTPDEVGDLFSTVQRAQKLTESYQESESSTISIQDGPEAGQSIPHLHVHVIPRKKGDFENNDDIYDKLQTHDKGDVKWRTEEEMVEEAKDLRIYLKSMRTV